MQQALEYTETLDVPFAYSSNGCPIPPLAAQCHIVANVAQRMAWVDTMEQPLAAARATAANFFSAPRGRTKPAESTVRPRRLLDFVPPLLRHRRRIHPR